MRIPLLGLLLIGPSLEARRPHFGIHPKRAQNNVVSRLRRILSNFEAREILRDNQTHVELQTIKDGVTEMKDALKEIKNATKDFSNATEIPESHQNEEPRSIKPWFDYSLQRTTGLQGTSGYRTGLDIEEKCVTGNGRKFRDGEEWLCDDNCNRCVCSCERRRPPSIGGWIPSAAVNTTQGSPSTQRTVGCKIGATKKTCHWQTKGKHYNFHF